MEHLGWLNTVLIVLALATAAGFGLQRGDRGNLKEQLEEFRAEVADKDRRLADKDRSLTEKDRLLEDAAAEIERQQRDAEVKAESLRRDMEALARMVTGEAHLVALEQKLDEHHEAAATHWQFNDQLLAEIRDELRKGNAP
jgi:chromosome segregation ATPase